MAAAEGGPVDGRLGQAIRQARGGGRPVPAELRGSMERALGGDFSRVRLHADPRADRFNRALQARAFTTGRDIFFRRGDYNPGSSLGRQLLAHELTHVVQQGGAASNAAPAVQRGMIQRVLTDEARGVLALANANQEGFTQLPDPGGLLGGRAEAIGLLEKNKYILASHLHRVMDLPRGAPAELESFVQAWLVRHLCAELLSHAVTFGNLGEEGRAKLIDLLVGGVEDIKEALINAGYGQPGEMTPELKSVITKYFGSSGGVQLDFDAHGVQHLPTGDPRKMEVCATYIPGRKLDVLGRAHSFVLYTDTSGKMTYVSAHDDGTGRLGAAFGFWSPSLFDDNNFDRVVVATGHAASAAFPAMLEAVEHLNSAGIKYKMTEQNCNSATHYILKAANLAHAQAPNFRTGQFGWRKQLEKKIKRPLPYYPALVLPPVTQTIATTTTAPPVPATVAMPTLPQQMPVLPPVRSTPTTTTLTTPRPARWQAVAPSHSIRSVGSAKPRLQPRAAPRGREEEESSEEQATPRRPGGPSATELGEGTYMLPVAVAVHGGGHVGAGTVLTVEVVGRANNQVKVRLQDGRRVIVKRDELEAAVGPLTG
jgi:hypothetical protein